MVETLADTITCKTKPARDDTEDRVCSRGGVAQRARALQVRDSHVTVRNGLARTSFL